MHREHRLTRRARLPDVEHWPHDARAVKRLVPLVCLWCASGSFRALPSKPRRDCNLCHGTCRALAFFERRTGKVMPVSGACLRASRERWGVGNQTAHGETNHLPR